MALSDATRLADFATAVGTGVTLNSKGLTISAGIITASSFVGSGADLTDVISGIGITAGSVTTNLGTGLTAVNFSGADVSFHEASGISTITIAKELVIGVRTGTAVTFSVPGSSFNVVNRAGSNVPISL